MQRTVGQEETSCIQKRSMTIHAAMLRVGKILPLTAVLSAKSLNESLSNLLCMYISGFRCVCGETIVL